MQGNGRSSRGRGQGREMKPGRRASACRFEDQGPRRAMAGGQINCAQSPRPFSNRQNPNHPWRIHSTGERELSKRIDENRKILDSIREKIDALFSPKA
jgi:hypothetical protein